MRTRRSVLTVMGAAALAGCSSSTAGTQSDSKQEIEEQDVYLPLDGLGQFGEKVLDADMENSEFTAEGIQTLLEPADNVEEEAELLAEITTPDNLYQVSNAYLSIKKEGDNVVAINQNHAFYQDSSPLLEFHTIEDGELQGQPALKAQGQTHFPGDQGPEYLKDMRDFEDAAQYVAQDYNSIQAGIEWGIENNGANEEQVRQYRAKRLNHFSRAILGVGSEPNLRPHSVADANTLLQSKYGEGSARAYQQLY